ncbi:MAG: N-acetylgalactosamine-6-sulfatase, partial [Planctomycetes bacterium]|nr:N-acetylgalactosamine-6-sulfatase [Planctomycetota bacterium]
GRSETTARDTFFYYVKNNLHAVRQGKWKLALPGRKAFFDYALDSVPVTSPQLYDLEHDVSETTDLAGERPDVVDRLLKLAETARQDIGDIDQPGKNARAWLR